jgi:NADPH:quinone reductase-like Zn-dependent oxidoreductase
LRALRYDRYGPPDVLRVEDIAEPTPAAGEFKIRVRAASLNPIDWKIRAGHLRFVPLLRTPPRGIGCDFAGEIVGVGGGATSHYVGERVFGSLPPFLRGGALAEYVVAAANRIASIPDSVSDEVAAALPIAGGTALQALLEEAKLALGQRVLITGAAGDVGHFAIQVAKQVGAHIVGVCSAGNIEFVRGLGADEVVDYARDDFTRRDDRFDVVFDAAGASSFMAARRVLTEMGCYLNTGGNAAAVVGTIVGSVFARLTSHQRAIAIVLKASADLFERVAVLAQQGALHAHVERTIGMEEVANAMAAMETGHGRGKIIVRL